MYENLSILRLSSALAGHAAQRQDLTARNIANADTPGFKAQDLNSFQNTFRSALQSSGPSAAEALNFGASVTDFSSETAPNGNNVSLETEMIRTAEIRHQHDLALSIYRSSLGILRTSLGKGR